MADTNLVPSEQLSSFDMSLIRFKPFELNPRKITEEKFKQLAESFEHLGDISCIVINHDGQIICGNQRDDILRVSIRPENVIIEKTYDTPTRTGTIAYGHVLGRNNEKYKIRFVKWDDTQATVANIAANKMGGDFDMEALANYLPSADLLQSGFSDNEVLAITFSQESVEKAFEQSPGKKKLSLTVQGLQIPMTNEECDMIEAYVLQYSLNTGTNEGVFEKLMQEFEEAISAIIENTQN